MLRSIPGVIINYYLIINVLFLLPFNFNIYLLLLFFLFGPSTYYPHPRHVTLYPRRSTKRQTRFYQITNSFTDLT